jgi:hypothetical protein
MKKLSIALLRKVTSLLTNILLPMFLLAFLGLIWYKFKASQELLTALTIFVPTTFFFALVLASLSVVLFRLQLIEKKKQIIRNLFNIPRSNPDLRCYSDRSVKKTPSPTFISVTTSIHRPGLSYMSTHERVFIEIELLGYGDTSKISDSDILKTIREATNELYYPIIQK